MSGIFGSQVKEYVFGDGVTSIGDYACYNCTNLASVTIPSRVTSIGECAFSGCRNLTSIYIPENITTIGVNAFSGCKSLLTVTIKCPLVGTWFRGNTSIWKLILGEGIRRINDEAFSGCTNILDVFCYANTVPITGSNAFRSVTGGAILHVPSSAMGSYRSQSPWREFYNIVALTDKETGIAAIDNGQQEVYEVYDMNGRKYTQMQRGVNIIRSADGTTRKVLVK